jgi:hypothetical protein
MPAHFDHFFCCSAERLPQSPMPNRIFDSRPSLRHANLWAPGLHNRISSLAIFSPAGRWITPRGPFNRGREAVVTARRKRGWSFKDDRRLVQLATSLKSRDAVAAEMSRSPKNIQRMAKRLGVSLKSAKEEVSPSKPARCPWTADELKKLDDLTKAGKTAVEIAAILQRTPTSIYAKLKVKRLLAESKVEEIGLVDPAQHEAEMNPAPRLKKSKGTWYVSFEPNARLPGQRGAPIRKTETFRDEQEAKAFAKAKQADGLNINAGTLNPYQPKRIVTSVQISGWLNEPDD